LPLLLALFCIEQLDNRYPIVDSSVARTAVAPEVSPSDYLFVGPSYCYNGIYTPILDSAGKSSFILGVATAGPYFYEILIDDYLAYCKKKPKVIFVNISPGTCSDIFDNWASYPIHRYLNNPLSNEKILWRYTDLKDYSLLLRKSIKKSFASLMQDHKKVVDDFEALKAGLAEAKGFSYSDLVLTDSILDLQRPVYNKFKTSLFNQDKADYFIGLVKKYKEQNINMVAFEVPTFRLRDFLSPEFKEAYLLFKERICQNKIDLIEDKSGVDDYAYFSTADHMNTRGAKLFTASLLKRITEQVAE